MIFPTGYSANVGVIAGLMRSGDLIVADQHAQDLEALRSQRRLDPVAKQRRAMIIQHELAETENTAPGLRTWLIRCADHLRR